MLQTIRNHAQGTFAWIILILICVPFLFWGIQNYVGGGQEQAVAVVGDEEIYQADLARAYQQMASRIGGVGQINEETLMQLALKNLIDEEVLRQTALDRGYVISDGQIREAIRAMPYFRNVDGFDKEKFDDTLRAQSISEPYFISQIRNGMEIGQLQDGITQSTFATETEIDRFLHLRDQLRTVEYVTVPVVESDVEIVAKEIEKYYRENSESFRYPEQISVQYVELNIDDIAAKLDVDDEAVFDFYEAQQDLYTRKERRKVSHILAAIDSKEGDAGEQAALEKISQAQNMLASGDAFAAVAKKLSDDTVSGKQGGNIGLINPGDMDKAFETAAYALSIGQVSDPIKSPFGYHLIKLTELEAGEVKPFEGVQEEVEKAYRRQAAENKFYELGENIAQISYENPDSLAPVAESANLEIKSSELFTRLETEGFGANGKIVEAAFSAQVLEGKNSDPIELSSNEVVVLRLIKHIPASSKPLKEVRDEVIDKIKTRSAMDTVKAKADRLLAQLREGTSLGEIAERNNLELSKPEPLSRSGKNIPWLLNKALFSAAKPAKDESVPLQVALPGGAQVVAVLLDVQSPSDSGEKEHKKETKLAEKWLVGQYGSAEFSELLAQLREDTEITVFENEE